MSGDSLQLQNPVPCMCICNHSSTLPSKYCNVTGYLRSKKRAKAGTPAAAAIPAKEDRGRKGSGRKAKQFARGGAMTGTTEEAAPKPGTQQPSEKDYSRGKVEEM